MKHKVTFKNVSRTVEIENGESIVSKANENGINIPFSCMQGMCTTCIATLLSGEIEYIEDPDPDTLTQEDVEENKILLCIATPKSDIEILEND